MTNLMAVRDLLLSEIEVKAGTGHRVPRPLCWPIVDNCDAIEGTWECQFQLTAFFAAEAVDRNDSGRHMLVIRASDQTLHDLLSE